MTKDETISTRMQRIRGELEPRAHLEGLDGRALGEIVDGIDAASARAEAASPEEAVR